jgi:tetratricopeptide (TPR) repeat protein
LLDLPALEVEWDAASADANEGTAFENLKKLDEAVEAYRKAYASLPESLKVLGPPVAGAAVAPRGGAARAGTAPKEPVASHDAAGLVDAEMAAGSKDGYEFRIIIVGASTLGAPAKYQLSATPSSYGRTGKRSFFRDAEGGWHTADHRGAVGSESDASIH